MWQEVSLGEPPGDHRACLLTSLDNEWTWVSAMSDLPESGDAVTRWLPLLRRCLLNHSDHMDAVILISTIFWTPSRPVSARLLRMIHTNPRNWCILPYIPQRYRNPTCKPWGRRLIKGLKEDGQWPTYQFYTMCRICGNH